MNIEILKVKVNSYLFINISFNPLFVEIQIKILLISTIAIQSNQELNNLFLK